MLHHLFCRLGKLLFCLGFQAGLLRRHQLRFLLRYLVQNHLSLSPRHLAFGRCLQRVFRRWCFLFLNLNLDFLSANLHQNEQVNSDSPQIHIHHRTHQNYFYPMNPLPVLIVNSQPPDHYLQNPIPFQFTFLLSQVS